MCANCVVSQFVPVMGRPHCPNVHMPDVYLLLTNAAVNVSISMVRTDTADNKKQGCCITGEDKRLN